jgi:hypothetical protein
MEEITNLVKKGKGKDFETTERKRVRVNQRQYFPVVSAGGNGSIGNLS